MRRVGRITVLSSCYHDSSSSTKGNLIRSKL